MNSRGRAWGRPARVATLAVTLGWAALTAGCGNLTAGGVAEAEVTVSGDAPDQASGADTYRPPSLAGALPWSGLGASARSAAVDPAAPRARDDEPEGEVEVEFGIYLVTAEGPEIPLDEDVRVRVDIRGRTEATAVRRRTIPAATYSAIRVVFTEIEAEVDEGLIIGGRPVEGPIVVELEGESLVVEQGPEFQVPAGGVVDVLLDLNSTAWLRAADPAVNRVARNIFRNALQLRVR